MIVHKLGRIVCADVILGGKYNSEIGISITMGASKHNGQDDSAWEVECFESFGSAIPNNSHVSVYDVFDLFHAANVTKLSELVGKPVVCLFKEGMLQKWKLLDTIA